MCLELHLDSEKLMKVSLCIAFVPKEIVELMCQYIASQELQEFQPLSSSGFCVQPTIRPDFCDLNKCVDVKQNLMSGKRETQ